MLFDAEKDFQPIILCLWRRVRRRSPDGASALCDIRPQATRILNPPRPSHDDPGLALGQQFAWVQIPGYTVWKTIVSATRPGPKPIAQPRAPGRSARIIRSSTNMIVAEDMLP